MPFITFIAHLPEDLEMVKMFGFDLITNFFVCNIYKLYIYI